MNIFAVDTDPRRAANALCDQHIVKMALESAQMLSTVSGGPYKPTHQHHPCTIWVGTSENNYMWLQIHAMELCREYTRRWGGLHQCERVIAALSTPPIELPPLGLTPFMQAMPQELRHVDHVRAYRAYYRTKTFARWRHSLPPKWFFETLP